MKSLHMYVDPSGMAAVNLNVFGLPSTLVLDARVASSGAMSVPPSGTASP